ncbi:MAG TPA: D-aminoacylase [Candidatus Latescibacteria bacterium]|jgi:N-acyl-D-aspartate/D-glutamate deacylase|nr:N-acyl-D-amino-acid deacylase [Gemmatimonadaceae bacterium]MDP6015322.1 D-aminoacylase [Candidatus Latescibacterota bacterium]HJP32006.1 D-aminoacylase [Candidatus Latescibacterota bacterium]
MYDLVLCNGRVLDGTGAPALSADVGIQEGRVVAVGDLSAVDARQTIDASERFVAPGFIDMHTHSDLTLVIEGRASSSLAQGITTQIAGNCGVSAAPTLDHEPYYGPLDPTMTRGLVCDWIGFDEYFERLDDQGIGTNVATLVGHGNIRVAAMGWEDRAARPGEMERMCQLTARAMEDGSLGLSSGLAYAPGPYAPLDELVELGKVVGRYGGLYTSHIRNQTLGIADAVGEVIEVGQRAGISAHVSHMQPGSPMLGATADLLATIDTVRAGGVDVSCDAIPYTIGSTTLKSLLPPWALDGGDKALLGRLRDPDMRHRIKVDTLTHGAESGGSRKRNLVKDGTWDRIWLGSAEANAHLAGKDFAEIGRIRDQDPHDAVLDILIEEEARPWMLAEDVSEQDFLNIARHATGGVISDGFSLIPEGVLAEGRHHPRSYAAFPYFLRRFIREQGALTWEQAVHKLTGHAAARFRLADRGVLREGAWADVVIFDPERIAEGADFDDPYRYPHGIDTVLVNGVAAVYEGRLTDSRSGRILRRAA